MTRPRVLVAVFGTATEVGKTWVGAQLLRGLRGGGLSVAARKPAESFEPGTPRDSQVLAAASGEDPRQVCPPHRRYEVPMAPPMAAQSLGRPAFTVAELVAEVTWPDAVPRRPSALASNRDAVGVSGEPAGATPDRLTGGVDVGLVETVGGPRSPVAADGDCVDLVSLLHPDRCLLVADAGLGVVNAVELAVAALAGLASAAPLVVLNRFDPADDLHRRNLAWLADRHPLTTTIDDLVAAVAASAVAAGGASAEGVQP